MGLRHPRKDWSSISSQAWRRRKLSGGHCECFWETSLEFVIIDTMKPTIRQHRWPSKQQASSNYDRNKMATFQITKRSHAYNETLAENQKRNFNLVSDIQGRIVSSTSSQARRRRKLLGGHCECSWETSLEICHHRHSSQTISTTRTSHPTLPWYKVH